MADRVKKKPAPLSSNALQLRISGLTLFDRKTANPTLIRAFFLRIHHLK
jgi:hypothetical protein